MSFVLQAPVDPGTAVRAPTRGKHTAYFGSQGRLALFAPTATLCALGVKTLASHTQRFAKMTHPEMSLLHLDKSESYSLSLAKKAVLDSTGHCNSWINTFAGVSKSSAFLGR